MSALPQPLFFGPHHALFGWLHGGASAARVSSFGVVVCSPHGFEEVCAHRGLLHMAQALSAAGIPTLRFDYDGCGDSAGDAIEGECLQRWVKSVHEAADALKAMSGVASVCLVWDPLESTCRHASLSIL